MLRIKWCSWCRNIFLSAKFKQISKQEKKKKESGEADLHDEEAEPVMQNCESD